MRARRFSTIFAATIGLLVPVSAYAGHGLELLDHPAPPGSTPGGLPSSTVNSGGPGAEWELIETFPTGNPHTDIDFFTQGGETYVSVGTLGSGPTAAARRSSS